MRRDEDHQPIGMPTGNPVRGAKKRGADYSRLFVLLATAGLLLARIPMLARRLFDPDEFEHVHAAWCVFKGMLPYRDFFEHHTPWYYYTLRPFFSWFDVDTSFESARHFLLFGRGLSFGLALLSVVIVFQIGRVLQDRGGDRGEDRGKIAGRSPVGLVACLLLVAQPIFLQKSIEIRPDVFALPFYLGGLWFLLCGIGRSTASTMRDLWYFLGAGLGVGAAIMCTQKELFVLPGALAGLGIWSLSAGTRGGAGSRILLTLAFLVSVCVPAALTWAVFASHHAGGEFIANNFLLNAKWKHIETHQLMELITGSWPVLALSLLGASLSLSRFIRSDRRRYEELLLFCVAAGLFAGVVVIPSAHRQYYLMPLPIVCLFAAKALFFLVERARERGRSLLLVFAIALAVLPVLALRDSFQSPNDRQLARLKQVFERTKPTDLVMDGWEGTGVFRPHAFHYFFLHEETVAMLPRERLDAYLDGLESGKPRPRLIAMDENLAALGPRFVSFVKRDYASSDGFFYFSRRTVD